MAGEVVVKKKKNFLKVPKDKRRQVAFKARIELDFFANFVKKCSFNDFYDLKLVAPAKKGNFFSKIRFRQFR